MAACTHGRGDGCPDCAIDRAAKDNPDVQRAKMLGRAIADLEWIVSSISSLVELGRLDLENDVFYCLKLGYDGARKTIKMDEQATEEIRREHKRFHSRD